MESDNVNYELDPVLRERCESRLFSLQKARAKQRGKSFLLDKERLIWLSNKNCAYCGTPPANELKYAKSSYFYSGLDRIDNSLGYEIGNVLPCCPFCNSLRGSMDFYTWINFLKNVARTNFYETSSLDVTKFEPSKKVSKTKRGKKKYWRGR